MEGSKPMSGIPASSRVLASIVALALVIVSWGCGSSIDSRLEEVRTLQDAGQFNESIEPLRSILAESPDLPEANHRLGVALVQTGQGSLAVWPLEKSAKSDEYAVASGLVLASAFMSLKAYEDSIRVTTRVLEVDPERTAAMRIRAQSYLSAGRKEEALADAKRITEVTPEDYQATVMVASVLMDQGKLDEAEAMFARVKELGTKSGDPSLAARGCLSVASFLDTGRKDRSRAEKEYESCLASYPTEPLALQLATQFYDQGREPEKATAMWRHAVTEAPENLSFRTVLAERVAATGNVDEAQTILTEAAESFGTPGAWQVLGDFQRRRGRGEAAAKSLDRAAQIAGGGDDTLRFSQADLYVELGQVDKAEEIAAAVTEPTYKELLRGRILLAKGDPAAALEAFDAGIRRWPNNAVARYYAGIAARDAGDNERAISELREAVRGDAAASDAALVLAGILLDRGEWKNAAALAAMHLQKRDPASLSAFSINARAAAANKDYDAARVTLETMKRVKGSEVLVAVERAAVERAAKGPETSLAVLEASKLDTKDPANELVLRGVVDDLISLKKSDQALARIDAAIAAHPDAAPLLELKGAALARMGKVADAQAAFAKAIAADPKNAQALIGLATLEAGASNLPRAVELLDQAAELAPRDGAARYMAAQLLVAQGKTEEAETRLRVVTRIAPANAAASNDLAWILATKGTDLDLALSLAERSRRIQPTADVTDTLGFVLLKRGDAATAVTVFEAALALRPKDPSIRYHLGLALAQSGNKDRAVTTLREAIDSGPFPEAEAAQQEIARLQQPQG
jgi:tetratricopeptide (TPR) repeat protein